MLYLTSYLFHNNHQGETNYRFHNIYYWRFIMKSSLSFLFLIPFVLVNFVLILFMIRKKQTTFSLLLLLTLLIPNLFMIILIGLIYGVILIFPIIPMLIYLLCFFIIMIIFFIRWNKNPHTYLEGASVDKTLIKMDQSRKLLQVANYSKFINFIWFIPNLILLFFSSNITISMINISSKFSTPDTKLMNALVNF